MKTESKVTLILAAIAIFMIGYGLGYSEGYNKTYNDNSYTQVDK